MTNARPATPSEYEAQSQEPQYGEENPIEEIIHHQEEYPSSKFPKSQKKIPSRKLATGNAKIASRKLPKASETSKKKIDAPALPDRPANEEELQDRIADLKEKLKLKSLGDSK